MTIITFNNKSYELDSRIEVGALVVKLIIENDFLLNDIAVVTDVGDFSIGRYNLRYPISFIGHEINIEYNNDMMTTAYIKAIEYYIYKCVRLDDEVKFLIDILENEIEKRRLGTSNIRELFTIDCINYNNTIDDVEDTILKNRIIKTLNKYTLEALKFDFNSLPSSTQQLVLDIDN